MQTTMIRTNGLDLLATAQKALVAQKDAKAAKRDDAATPGNSAVMAELHKMVEGAEKGHFAAVRALGHFMDNSRNSAIDAYTATRVLSTLFGHSVPTFATFLKVRK